MKEMKFRVTNRLLSFVKQLLICSDIKILKINPETEIIRAFLPSNHIFLFPHSLSLLLFATSLPPFPLPPPFATLPLLSSLTHSSLASGDTHWRKPEFANVPPSSIAGFE